VLRLSEDGFKSHLRKLAYPAVRGACYVCFALHRLLSCCRPAIVPYLRRRARARAGASSTLRAAGISILISGQQTPPLLDECLRSVQAACRLLKEPWEVLVIVNGAAEPGYAELRRRFPTVRWLSSPTASGFYDGVCAGLPVTSYHWVYLLNSDMVLDDQALAELVPWRGPGVFAVASQVFCQDPQERRQGTGWRRMAFQGGMAEFRDVPPECPDTVRGTIYAGGFAALFQKLPLQHLLNRKLAAPPTHYEAVEWGIVAWMNGYASLFCPRSRVTIPHRATYYRGCSDDELTWQWRVHQCRFQLRNPMPGRSDWDFLKAADAGALLAAAKGWALPTGFAHRLRSLLYPWDASILEHTHMAWIQEPPALQSGKPTILMVAPYCLFPPTHGGAVRITRLLEEMRGAYRFVLLTDEGESYAPASRDYLPMLAGLHPIVGRCEPSLGTRPRIARIKSHSNEKLRNWLEWLQPFWGADLVQIEWMESAALLKGKPERIPWVLSLHEVLLGEIPGQASREDRFELGLIRRYSAATACCEEDIALLPGVTARVVPNGIKVATGDYCPSSLEPVVLFMGSLRYRPNLTGIQHFLRSVYPHLRQRLPTLALWILGGTSARESTAVMEEFHQAGVTIVDYVQHPREWLRRCSLTINPLVGTRGSCIKVLDSLSAGRVCVSTRQGARGFLQSGLPQLVTVETIEEFEPLLHDLLSHVDARRSVERPSDEHLAGLAWRNSAASQDRLYQDLLQHRLPLNMARAVRGMAGKR
jgi:GT2 family glycosyltransferase